MSKMPIEWYEKIIINSSVSAKRYRDEAASLIDRAFKIEEENKFLQSQIDLAKKRGLREFDRDRLGLKPGGKRVSD